jgi:hypothetical protein
MANPSGIFWDIALAAALGILQLGLAYLGWRVSAPEHKMLGYVFLLVGLFGVGLTVALAYRAASSQNELQGQLNRLLFQINDVSVSFRIKVPLDHPALSSYRARIEKCAEEIAAVGQMRCGATPHSVDISPNAPVKDFFLPVGSELFPNPQTEEMAYTLLDQAAVVVSLFKTTKPNARQPESLTNSDLRFMVNKQLDSPANVTPDNTHYIALYYDIASKSLFVQGNRVPVNEATWKTNGSIAALPDLQQTSLMASPSVSLISLVETDIGYRATMATAIANEISQKTISLERLTLHMSKGYEFDFSKGQLGAVAATPDGEPFYIAPIGEQTQKR